ncbi:Iqca [Phodopus roborovskii]|uniref:Iqca protein n=1 Tax=Phodopus roborovskii TaxID=109678 RepID=A0AAU9ZH04_PHORO|nr:Iqca [Phodopus roborovskii]
MYNKMWHQTQEALNSLLDKDSQKMTEPQRNKVLVFQMLATFYIKYVQIFRNMENVYDQIVHPQKRMLIRKVLDGVMGRILELKNEMVELELTEFHYFDDILQDLKLAPQQLDVPIPRYFLKERLEVIKGREKILARILNECGLNLPSVKYTVKSIALEEAVKLIQIAERARQGRLRALFMKQIFLQECRAKEIKLLGQRLADTSLAALQIQKVWRGFHQSRKTVKEREEEMIFLGMIHLTSLSTHILSLHRNLTGTFPEYPNEEDGGSAIIFSNKTPEQVIEDILASQEEEEKLKKKKKKEEKENKPKKSKKEKERKVNMKEKAIKEEDEEWKMSPSLFLQLMEEGNSLYKDTWMNKDETWNFPQDYDPEMIKEEKRKELELEIRVQVDELMRQELKNLKLAVNKEIEHPIRGKKGKKTIVFLREAFGNSIDSHGLVCQCVLVTETMCFLPRTIESLYKELVEEGLLIQALKVNLSDYIGEYSYLGTTLRQVAIEPMPSLLDVRQLITLYGILPLGSPEVHEKAPLVKSLLLAGPPGVGKKMLVHAICTETGANLFNLSSSNIAGKYPGKNGLQMMLHLVFKVARQLQPSVVWIQDTEKTFYKKVPQAEKLTTPPDPTSTLPLLSPRPHKHHPWLSLLCRRWILWKQIILRNGGVLTNALNISCLSKVTDGFTQGQIVKVVKEVLTDRRIRQQSHKPLTAVEFITIMTTMNPVYKEEEESFKNWYAKTPLGKKRIMSLSVGGVKEKEKDKGKKKGKKGKKKK